MESVDIVETRTEEAAFARKETILQRIWRYKLHYLIVIPAMLFILIFKIYPFLTGFVMSVVDYKVFAGIWNSSFVGFDNYASLLQDNDFRSALINTISYKLTYVVIASVLALLAALGLSCIRSARLRAAATTLMLVPSVIPSVVLGILAARLAGAELLLQDGSFRAVLLSVELAATIGIPTVIALAAIASRHAEAVEGESGFMRLNVIPAARAVAAFACLNLALLLTTDKELLNVLINPIVSGSAQTLDLYMIRIGFMNAQYSLSAALWFIQFGVQLVLAIVAYFIIRGKLLSGLFHRAAEWAPLRSAGGQGSGLAGGAAGVVLCAGALLTIAMVFVYPFTIPNETSSNLSQMHPVWNAVIYFILYFIATIGHMLTVLALAFPMTTAGRLPGGTLYRLFLIGVLLMGSLSVHEYMFIRDMGMSNTVFPVLFTGVLNIASVFVLKGIFNRRYGDLKAKAEAEGKGELHAFFYLYIPKIWKPLLALGALHLILLWNAYYPSWLYHADSNLYTPTMTMYAVSNSAPEAEGWFLRYGAFISLPPLLLFLLMRRWMTAEIWLGGIKKP